MSIHDELERIASRAPDVVVPDDTWARAQRARRWDRVGLVAVVVAVLAVAGSLAWLPGRDDPPIADTGSLGVPDHLWGVPARMAEREDAGSWVRDEVSTDLRIGAAAAAWVTDDGLVVVVDAEDGSYHLLDLPGFNADDFLVARGPGTAVSLSPGGRRLAYSYAYLDSGANSPVPSGILVVDLTTGRRKDVRIRGGKGTAVSELAWSSDGRWLGWAGEQFTQWDAASIGDPTPYAGRVDLRTDIVDRTRIEDAAWVTVAVADGGALSVIGNNQVLRWDGERRTESRVRDFWSGPGVVTADGSVAAGTEELMVHLLSPAGKVSRIEASGDLNPVAGGQAWVLGTVGDRLVVRTSTLDASPGALLLLATDGRAETVATVEGDVPDTLSIATDLMASDRPTVTRPEPDWPWAATGWVTDLGVWLLIATVGVAIGIRPARRWRQARAAR